MNRRRWILAGAAVGFLWVIGFLSGRFTGKGQAFPHPSAAAQRVSEGASPSSSSERIPSPHPWLEEARAARREGSLLKAKRLYQKVLQQASDPQAASEALEQLGAVKLALILSDAADPDSLVYTVQPGDTLSKIAQQQGTTVELLKVANGLQGDLIRVGQRLKVTQARFNVLVDKSQNLLTLKDGEEVLKVYRCSTGEGGITPTGDFKIVTRIVDPVWKGIFPPGHPENPLGSRWMGFDLPEYGLHGTNEPETIGQPVTRGCVRLTNADVEELYLLLPEGTPVTIIE